MLHVVARVARPARHCRPCAWTASRPFSISRDEHEAGGTRLQRQIQPDDLRDARPLSPQYLLSPSMNADWQVIQDEHLRYVAAPPQWNDRLDELQQRMGVRFRNAIHLKTALVHHGAIPQHQLPAEVATQRLSNRSLEFLGDSLLGMAVSSFVFQSKPLFQEGQLTRLKAILVNNDTLSKVAVHDLGLHDLILVAKEFDLADPPNEKWYHKGRATIHAGAVEALIAAVYVDQGLERALAFVNDVVLPSAIKYASTEDTFQPVVELQNLLQAHGYGHPAYKRVPGLSSSGEFQVDLFVRDEYVLSGEGASYKEARARAAHKGWTHFIKALSPAD